jgi:Fe-S oxidoreductase
VGRPIILWPDTFNDVFFPELLIAATQVLEHTGHVVSIPRERLCCGRALYDFGMLDTAKRLWSRTLSTLAPELERGISIVGIEPSCVTAFRDELPNLFPNHEVARRLAAQTKTLAELLDERDDLDLGRLDGHALVHFHCHHRSVLGIEPDRRMLTRLGLDVQIPEPGCCGMAGAFGFERDKLDISLQIGERALLPAVREVDMGTLIVADGFSCREQIQQVTGRQPLHLVELLARAQRG